MIEFKQIKALIQGDLKGTYEIGNYKVDFQHYGDEFNIELRATKRYMPNIYYTDEIYDHTNFEYKKVFEIDTVGYAKTSIDEIQEIIQGYQEAIEVVKLLENLIEEREGK